MLVSKGGGKKSTGLAAYNSYLETVALTPAKWASQPKYAGVSAAGMDTTDTWKRPMCSAIARNGMPVYLGEVSVSPDAYQVVVDEVMVSTP